MGKIDDMLLGQEQQLDMILKEGRDRVYNSIKKLETSLIAKATKYIQGGDPDKASFSFKQGQAYHKDLVREFDATFKPEIQDRINQSYQEVDKFVMSNFGNMEIPASYTKTDRDMFKALQQQDFKVYETLADDTVNNIAQGVYDSVIVGSSFNSLVDIIRQQVTGYSDVRGGSLARYATTYAQDSLMQYYRRVNAKKSDDAGLDTFIYYGNTMETSRPFCVANVGRTFTKAEIDDMNKIDWQGKSGDLWSCMGGYNCRHRWVAIKPEWLGDEVNPVTVNSNDLNKETMSKVASVNKEIDKILNPPPVAKNGAINAVPAIRDNTDIKEVMISLDTMFTDAEGNSKYFPRERKYYDYIQKKVETLETTKTLSFSDVAQEGSFWAHRDGEIKVSNISKYWGTDTIKDAFFNAMQKIKTDGANAMLNEQEEKVMSIFYHETVHNQSAIWHNSTNKNNLKYFAGRFMETLTEIKGQHSYGELLDDLAPGLKPRYDLANQVWDSYSHWTHNIYSLCNVMGVDNGKKLADAALTILKEVPTTQVGDRQLTAFMDWMRAEPGSRLGDFEKALGKAKVKNLIKTSIAENYRDVDFIKVMQGELEKADAKI